MLRLENFNFITCVIMMLFLMAPSCFEPNNTHLVTGQRNDQPSLFILNYAKKENDEQFHMLADGNGAEYELVNKKSTTPMDTSSTTIPIPTTIELTTTEDPTTTEVATTTEVTTTEETTTKVPTTTEEPMETTIRIHDDRGYKRGKRPYVASGYPVDRKKYPYVVKIGWGKSSNSTEWGCSGTILHPNYVLSAAHCLFRTADVIFVDVAGTLHAVTNVFIFPKYEPLHKYHDIALLQLNYTLKFNNDLYPACLGFEIHFNTMLKAKGWTSEGLLLGEYFSVPDYICKGVPGAPPDVYHRSVGCGENIGVSAIVCDKGYDGGPITKYSNTDNKLKQPYCTKATALAGLITHHPLQCGRKSSKKLAAFVYTHLYPYEDWIIETIKKNGPAK